MPEFIIYALVAGIGLATVMGAIGVFVVWRRMAYFGDTLAHSALLGVAVGFIIGININVGIIAVCLIIAIGMVYLRSQRHLAEDTLLGILAHSSLALGLAAISLFSALRIDLMSYLFGDILAVTPEDIAWVYGGGIITLGVLAWLWKDLISITVHEDLARTDGVNIFRTQLVFMTLFALVIAMAMKIIGILLVTALLIIPAAAARRFARTPEQMAVFAAIAGSIAVAIGLQGSLLWDLPTGPAIVIAAALLYAASLAFPMQQNSR
ncbi:MAG: zinc ABC transporter permease subunit ZnuB [Pseudomonadota bacterium]|nr:zinc ABC transporter permease subunit ZnuB [Pseudomonadota bacterium]MEC7942849.1 zinc ABC transporter permease subunit ZnuB [Pseudomonadota bacterium]MEC8086995.1 zinc ABC transporter permease subunit ZnuB [Pseudomonadota bacterium]MEC8531608.1 zinc ABC transporter permease subunit ZnuB [Pseudomonadota bacterium]|tara:strand:- start:1567 stop:2361 length:795 start_codon:yes stop_codon:yes gene_type:complete